MSEAVVLHHPTAAASKLGMGELGSQRGEAGALDPLSDTQLARLVQEGDTGAFGAIVSRHMRRAFAVAMRLLDQREDAEDLVQDAFIAALEKIDTFDAEREFAPWFYRILVNRCLNARKARSRRSTVEISDDAASAVASPLTETERAELRTHLKRALDRLPERQRTIVALFDIEGFSSPEVAEILGISDGTVRWHLHQARQVLREALGPYARREG